MLNLCIYHQGCEITTFLKWSELTFDPFRARSYLLPWTCVWEKCWKVIFSHLCLYKIGFLPMWETSISYNHKVDWLVLGKIHLNWEKKNPSWASPCRIGKSHSRGRNFNQALQASSLVEIPIPRMRFPYPVWTLMTDSFILRMFERLMEDTYKMCLK